jgi:hypothetical protein
MNAVMSSANDLLSAAVSEGDFDSWRGGRAALRRRLLGSRRGSSPSGGLDCEPVEEESGEDDVDDVDDVGDVGDGEDARRCRGDEVIRAWEEDGDWWDCAEGEFRGWRDGDVRVGGAGTGPPWPSGWFQASDPLPLPIDE